MWPKKNVFILLGRDLANTVFFSLFFITQTGLSENIKMEIASRLNTTLIQQSHFVAFLY